MVVRLFCGQARRLFALLLGLLVLLLVGTAQAAEKEYYYATDALNLRQGPGMEHTVKGEVALGERVALLGLEGKWAKIQTAQGTTGYVFSAYLAPSGDTAATYYAATDLNLRAGPGMSHEVVGELLEGETVKRLHTVGNWALVEGEKGIGYAFTRYLSIRTPAQPEPSGGRMRFATLEDAGALYGDPACTQHMDFLQYYYAAKQRVVVLADLGDVKQVAVYGYGAYVKAEKLSGLSEEYDKTRDQPALYQYNLAMAGEAYRAAFAEDPGYGGFGYDRGDGTCVLFFKEDAMPDVKLEPGFKLAACRYSLAELETGLAKVHALARQMGWKQGADYQAEIRFQEDYFLPLNRQRNLLRIDVFFQPVDGYAQFQRLLEKNLDPEMYQVGLVLA